MYVFTITIYKWILNKCSTETFGNWPLFENVKTDRNT